jgi:cytochrome c oxidase cbb3-type subunit 3
MAIRERDPHTGHMTIGHEWNGITELNRPVPTPVWWFLGAAVLFSVVFWVLMPAWPLGDTYTRGLLGVDQRTTVVQKLAEAEQQQAEWRRRIAAADFAEIEADEALMRVVRGAGSALFGDNCSACHGAAGRGGPGYPSLVDDAWLWGGAPESIAETLRVGVNAPHPDTRVSEMPAFGHDQILDREAILQVAAYVRSLADPVSAAASHSQAVAAGKEIFAANCAGCHGDNGQGNSDAGAPNLSDSFWLYGGDPQTVFRTIFYGRKGHMPAWEHRLTELERKILALYIRDLQSWPEGARR